MNARRMLQRLVCVSCCAVRGVVYPAEQHRRSASCTGQRLEVDARLDAAGHLEVAETQTIVFTGDWNGGERKINLRPHQQLSAVRMSRAYGGELRELTEDHRLLKVDDFQPDRPTDGSMAQPTARPIRRLPARRSPTCCDTGSQERS